ncbi:MAG: S41 family peptidase [Pseudomonadota bacterium]
MSNASTYAKRRDRFRSRSLVLGALFALFINTAVVGVAEGASPDYSELADSIRRVMQAQHYNPGELKSAAFDVTSAAVAELAKTAESDEAFVSGFNEIWKSGPFSHVTLAVARQPAAALAEYLDTVRVGDDAVTLSWNDRVAVLTVKTMMGIDTIENISGAFVEIAESDATGLIVDLRENTGGAFAIRPLIAHLIDTPLDAGGFVSQRWYSEHQRTPAEIDILAMEPWNGWSIRAFWSDVQSLPLIRVRFTPAEPRFSGPVVVLTSRRTASAAELATDALQGAKRVTVIGETSAGEMLSQKIFDIPGGFHLSVPIADYYSRTGRRIEGHGIQPDIVVDAAAAMDVALDQFQ